MRALLAEVKRTPDARLRAAAETLERATAVVLDAQGRDPDAGQSVAVAYLEAAGGNLELLQLLDAENRPVPFSAPAPTPPYCPHVALGVDDLDGMAATLSAAGVPLLAGPLEIPGRVRWAYVADPDNNVLEFVQWL